MYTWEGRLFPSPFTFVHTKVAPPLTNFVIYPLFPNCIQNDVMSQRFSLSVLYYFLLISIRSSKQSSKTESVTDTSTKFGLRKVDYFWTTMAKGNTIFCMEEIKENQESTNGDFANNYEFCKFIQIRGSTVIVRFYGVLRIKIQ